MSSVQESEARTSMRKLSRREFLTRTTVASGTVLAAGVLSSCGPGASGGGGGGSSDEQLSKQLNFIVPSSPGGGFDTTARTLAPYLEKYLPTGTHITIRNLPGGNYVPSVNRVMSGKNDTIGIFNIPGALAPPITGQADYNLADIQWIGLPAQGTYVAVASPKSGVKTIKDIRSMPKLTVGVETLTSTSAIGAEIALDNLGIKKSRLNLVTHEGSSEAELAAVRGDVDFIQYPVPSLRQYIVDSKELTPLWVYSSERLDILPNVPTFEEVGGDPKLLNVIVLYRPIGTGPNTSPTALKTLRDALAKAMKDDELVKKMEAEDLEPTYKNPEQTGAIINAGTEQMRKYKSLLTG